MNPTKSVLTDESTLISTVLRHAFDAIIYLIPRRIRNSEIIDFTFEFLADPGLNTVYGKKEDYIGKSFLSQFPYAAINGIFEDYRKTAETGIPNEDNYYFEKGTGNGWYWSSMMKYRDGIIVYIRDVTTQKNNELLMRGQAEELRMLLKEKNKLLAEKEILLSESRTRIKSNLEVLSRLVNVQGSRKEDGKPCDVCQRSIATIAMINRKTEEKGNYRSVDMESFISEIISYHRQLASLAGQRIIFSSHVDECLIDLNSSINIGLILNELLSNSIKYAFRTGDKSIITVKIKKDGTGICAEISDNGVGIPAQIDIHSPQTLGFTLINSTVKQLNGTIELAAEQGTKFILRVPGLFEE